MTDGNGDEKQPSTSKVVEERNVQLPSSTVHNNSTVTTKKDPDKTLTTAQRRIKIKETIERQGLWNINKTAIAERYGVSRDTIYNDINRIIESAPKEDIEQVQYELAAGFKQAVKTLREEMNNFEEKADRIKAANAYARVANDYTKLLEDYGLKDKISDKLDVSGIPISISVVLPSEELLEDDEDDEE